MTPDGYVPGTCDSEIFQNGEPVALPDAKSAAAEPWVRSVADAADARLDWHLSGGVVQVLHLGDSDSRARVEAAITQLGCNLDGRILHRLPIGAEGLYRHGVTSVSQETDGCFYDGGGGSTYLVKE